MKLYLRRFKRVASTYYPAGLTILFIILSLMPRRIFPWVDMVPDLALISLFYWKLYYPDSMPFWAVCVIGLVQDTLMGLPLGLSSFLYLIFSFALTTQRKVFARETFFTLWFGFTVLVAGFYLLLWLLLYGANGTSLPVVVVFLQWGLTVGLYPPLHMLCNLVYTSMPSRLNRR